MYVFGRKLRSTNKIDVIYYVFGCILLSGMLFLLSAALGIISAVAAIGGLLALFLSFGRDDRVAHEPNAASGHGLRAWIKKNVCARK